ncbi:Fis family transcriptional regulator [Burkholderia vietnamiensis]|jgi:hypothetical protein|uniref:Transcriptional regulator, Fis family n=5 Tax=Burkholderia cepacia complex TaxID=87882 RepID=A4JRK0_BURVG|nr:MULTISPECIES: hypothetical protein [Burkholderia]ABO58903.1 transcriptional regulator, Fis family [Burkholderia vietnamiensis G4]AFJ89818.1 hypothetical protein MYA_5475 [Burkholderia sp. KJ006]AJY08968.1 transcriptional regulator, Fis family [Burkholderia vietnamiensis LMG 10929]AOJ76560.1 Fis family transcriptional regulator [Burkholderia ubonensis]AOK13649.1 Fis family transcriptional regulator [Burkholderia vietnamiensis]
MTLRRSPVRSRNKAMLLPTPRATVDRQSLEYHLVLAAIRAGHGNERQLSRLVEILFLAEFLHEAGYGDGDQAAFAEMEAALRRCTDRGHTTGEWRMDAQDHGHVAQLLTLHDRQLARAPLHAVATATERLRRLLAKAALALGVARQAA